MGLNAAVLVSGEGSNLEALASAARENRLGLEILRVVADRECPAIERASGFGIPAVRANPADPQDLARAAEGADLILLAGFRRILPADFVSARAGRILNVHPSLLPAFPGLGAIRRAHETGVRVTGVTIHVVTPLVDAGPILAQEAVAVEEGGTLASLESMIHAVEHRLYPETVARFATQRFAGR